MGRGTRIALGLAATLWTAGCSQAEAPPPLDGAAEWLADVESAHLSVDEALSRGERERAAAILRQALDAEVPASVSATHARVVQQDLAFRLAEAELSRGEALAALAAADHGLARGRGQDVFTTNLLIVRGAALEAEGRDTAAASSYYEALQIAQAQLAELLKPDAEVP